MNIKKKKNLSRIVILLTALFSLFLIWWFFLKSPSSIGEDDINYAPATKEDKRLNDDIKSNIPASTDSGSDDNQAAVKVVKPFISAWGQPGGSGSDFQLNGFVDGIVESEGSCTLAMRRNGITVDVTKQSLQNAQNTSCGQMAIAYSKLTPGKWEATLSYSSATSKGSSDPVIVEVR
jgi:hypothetical protein